KVTVPQDATSVSFPIATSAVAAATPVTINTGTANDNYRAPETRLTLLPAGAPAPAPSLAAVTVASPSVLGGHTTTGTVTLTGPAPAGGASVWVNGSMEGDTVTPSGGVTVPAGATSADFTITAGQVTVPFWVMIQASYGSGNSGMHGAVLRIDPDQPAIPDLYAMALDGVSTLGGGSLNGTVGLATPAPAGGTTVSLTSTDPSTAQVPPSVFIAAGNSTNSFTVTTNASTANFTSVQISARSGSVTKDQWISVYPDPNAGGTLSSVTTSASTVTGGSSLAGTVTLSKAAPSGGAQVTLSTSNPVATPPNFATVPAGQTSVGFTIATSAVSANTPATIKI